MDGALLGCACRSDEQILIMMRCLQRTRIILERMVGLVNILELKLAELAQLFISVNGPRRLGDVGEIRQEFSDRTCCVR